MVGGGWVGEIKIQAKLSPAKAGVRAELGKNCNVARIVYIWCNDLRTGIIWTMKRLHKTNSKIATLYKIQRICVTLIYER